MQAYGMALDLRDDPALIARYRTEHARAWPAVLARLREVGVTEMKIFLLGRRMFMYCETRDGFFLFQNKEGVAKGLPTNELATSMYINSAQRARSVVGRVLLAHPDHIPSYLKM